MSSHRIGVGALVASLAGITAALGEPQLAGGPMPGIAPPRGIGPLRPDPMGRPAGSKLARRCERGLRVRGY